jgi:hypothetical protein
LASIDFVDFTKKYEREFSLMSGSIGSGCTMFEKIEVWFMDNGASRHMTRMRFVFLSLLEIDSDYFMDSGVESQFLMKGVVSVRFQLELGGFSGGRQSVVYFINDSKLSLSVSFGD